MLTRRRGLLLVLVLSIGACAVDLALEPGRAEAALPADAAAYFAVRTDRLSKALHAIIEQFELDHDEVRGLLDSSTRIVAAVGDRGADSDSEVRPLSAVAEGAYRGGRLRFGLSLSRQWKRTSIEGPGGSGRYYQERSGLGQIAVPGSNFVLFSNGALPAMLDRIATRRGGVDELEMDRDAHLFVVLPQLTPELKAQLPADVRGLPIDSVRVGVFERDEPDTAFTISGEVYFESDRAAQVFNVVGRLVIATLSEGVPLRDISVERSGTRIVFDGMRVTEPTLLGWIETFAATLVSPEGPAGGEA